MPGARQRPQRFCARSSGWSAWPSRQRLLVLLLLGVWGRLDSTSSRALGDLAPLPAVSCVARGESVIKC